MHTTTTRTTVQTSMLIFFPIALTFYSRLPVYNVHKIEVPESTRFLHFWYVRVHLLHVLQAVGHVLRWTCVFWLRHHGQSLQHTFCLSSSRFLVLWHCVQGISWIHKEGDAWSSWHCHNRCWAYAAGPWNDDGHGCQYPWVYASWAWPLQIGLTDGEQTVPSSSWRS